MPTRITSEERISRALARVTIDPVRGCWISGASLAPNGYARVCLIGASGERRLVRFHRLSYERHIGPIPAGMRVLHECDVRSCVNPKHLFLGTQADNVADMHKKGRARTGRRIPPDVKAEIRRIYKDEGMPIYRLAERFGASPRTVAAIVRDIRSDQPGKPSGRAAKDVCARGHLLTPDNLYRWGRLRRCRICLRAQWDARSLTRKHTIAKASA